MEKFQLDKIETKETNKEKLLKRLGPLAVKFTILLSLASLYLEGNAQETQKLDETKMMFKYEDGRSIPISFKKGVDFELKDQNIRMDPNKGSFELKNDFLSFDNTSVPTDSVHVMQLIKQIPGGKEITKLEFSVFNNDGSIEHVIVDDGEIDDYSVENPKQ